MFRPLFLYKYENLGILNISITTFHKIYKNFLLENKLTESDLGRFAICKHCLKWKREARLDMTSADSSAALKCLSDHLEQIRVLRYCLKALEDLAEKNNQQFLFLQYDRQDQRTTSLPFFKKCVNFRILF